MHDQPPGIRRLCVAFGIESSGEHDGAAQAPAGQRVADAITGVCTALGLDRMLLNRPGPDGEQVGLLPVGIDEPRVVSSLVEGLHSALAELNRPQQGGHPVRLRVAFHEGVTTLAADGFGGRAVTKVRELAGSPHLRAALDEHPRASLAVVLSDPVFEGVGHSGHPSLPADQFQPVEIADSGPAPASTAWIYVPA
jgi:hypothetical protein